MNQTPTTYEIHTPEICIAEVMAELNRHGGTVGATVQNGANISVTVKISDQQMQIYKKWFEKVIGGRGEIKKI